MHQQYLDEVKNLDSHEKSFNKLKINSQNRRKVFLEFIANLKNVTDLYPDDFLDEDYSNPVFDGDVPNYYTYGEYNDTYNDLIPGTSYKWRVRVASDYNKSIWSDEGSFTLDNITILTPQGEQSTVKPRFTIDGPKNVSKYRITIYQDQGDNLFEAK